MSEAEVYEKVVGVITPFAKNADALAAISRDTNILDDLEVNSARLVDIMLEFEDAFDIEVEDEAADNIATVGDAVQLIVQKTS
ncbi:MAG: acyl carrier protein [Gammaproteobacteria bacterium]|nr:acyl carrier protein [Gammaproteobacteria bacterium]